MSDFCTALNGVPGLLGHCRTGLHALEARDRKRVTAAEPRRLSGSCNVDQALQPTRPHESRWDYAIGLGPEPSAVFWVEVHPANSSHVGEVLQKLSWLERLIAEQASQPIAVLHQAAKAAGKPPSFVWVASGSVQIPGSTSAARRLRTSGITGPVTRLLLQ